MRSTSLLALAASISATSAVFQGFNYGATKTDGSFMFQSDFEAKFQNAKNLVGTNGGFTSARLYTMIQGGSSTNEPTQAIPAAINQGVTLLLGLWASAGDGDMQAEITALKSAISQYGTNFTSLVAGISVGSEDLYRNSPTGIAALSGAGANPADIVRYIGEVRSALQSTPLSGALIGHVDTWTSWVNASNNDVAAACDWIGMDAYPYFQNTMANSIDSGKQLFNDALAATQAAVNGKPVWVTETGWPVSGKTEGQGVPSTANAQTYWEHVGCPLFGNVNTWWFTMQDADPTTPNPSFGLVGSTLSTTPLYDLSCNAVSSSSSAPASSTAVASSSAASSGSPSSAVGSASSQASQTTQTSQESQPSTTAVASSIIASLLSAATASTLVTGGSGLGPSQGVPVVSNPSATPTGTGGGVSPSAPSVSIGNVSTPIVIPTLSSSTTGGAGTTSTSPPGTNAAAALSAGPVLGVAGLLAALVAVL